MLLGLTFSDLDPTLIDPDRMMTACSGAIFFANEE